MATFEEHTGDMGMEQLDADQQTLTAAIETDIAQRRAAVAERARLQAEAVLEEARIVDALLARTAEAATAQVAAGTLTFNDVDTSGDRQLQPWEIERVLVPIYDAVHAAYLDEQFQQFVDSFAALGPVEEPAA